MAGNANFNNILTTTLNKHRNRLTDNVFAARPLTFFLKKAGNIRMDDGGAKIVEPIIIATNSTAVSYSGADTLSLQSATAQEFSAAEYDWKQAGVNVLITGLDEAKNAGSTRILNLLEAKIQVAEESLIQKFNTMFFDDGTGNSSKDWNGLKNLVTNTGTVGGINAATETYWQSYVEGSAGALTIAAMVTAWNSASFGADQPGFVLTTQTLFEKYESLLQADVRYTSMSVGDGGFNMLEFKGRPVVYDDDCPTGYVYFINPKYIKLVGHSQKWFYSTPFFTPQNQDVRSAWIYCYGNLVTNSKRHQAVLTDRTA